MFLTPAAPTGRPRAAKQSGFTLMEVLVALAVLAIALAAVTRVVVQAGNISYALRDRIQAQWLAKNQLVTLHLQNAWPDADTRTGRETFAGREWYWRQQISQVAEQDLRQVEIEIRLHEEQESLSRLVGFLRKPAS